MKGHELHDSIFRKCPEYANPWRQKVDRLVTAKDGTGGMSTSQYTVSFWGGKNVL